MYLIKANVFIVIVRIGIHRQDIRFVRRGKATRYFISLGNLCFIFLAMIFVLCIVDLSILVSGCFAAETKTLEDVWV